MSVAVVIAGLLAVVLTAWPAALRAEPYLAVAQGLKCVACHVNPSGGGMRNGAGVAYTQSALAANPAPAPLGAWTGRVTDFLRIGSDLRASQSRTAVPTQPTQSNRGLDQWRLYADLELIADRLGLVLDETLAPGKATRQEAYVRATTAGMGLYLKAGQFYLPFGWRLQDGSAYVRSVSGIGMSAPDKGVEFGLEQGPWSAQLAYTRGPGNVGTGTGHQVTAQLVWVESDWRLGTMFAATASSAGDRQVSGLFAGLRTGPVAWLGEIDLVRDDGYPEGRRSLLAALAEANWRIAQGHNLKLTAELFDPDRHLGHDHKVRQSLVYEYTPWAFVQLRLGLRRHEGIPQSNLDNRRVSFIELHGLF